VERVLQGEVMIEHALVIGGGIAGTVTAMALQRAGINATVYEAYGTTADGVGGALTLAPNGRNALRQIDAEDAVVAVGDEVPGMVMQNHKGRVVGRFEGLPGLPASLLLRRDRLYRALMDEVLRRGITVEFGKRLTAVDDEGDKVVARFEDGSSAIGEVLVGADGIRSAVRSTLDPAAPAPRFTGLLGFGGWIRNPGMPVTGAYQHFAFGKRAFFGYYIDKREILWFSNVPAASAAEAKTASPEQWLAALHHQPAHARGRPVPRGTRRHPHGPNLAPRTCGPGRRRGPPHLAKLRPGCVPGDRKLTRTRPRLT
jgi:FAD-dependent urate hydroxylase